MNDSTTSPAADASRKTNGGPRRPLWYWLLLFLPAAITAVPTLIDWVVYSLRGGRDGTRLLASGFTFMFISLLVGLITSVRLTSWEIRNRPPRAPRVIMALFLYIGFNALNLGLTSAGCMVGGLAGGLAADAAVRVIR